MPNRLHIEMRRLLFFAESENLAICTYQSVNFLTVLTIFLCFLLKNAVFFWLKVELTFILLYRIIKKIIALAVSAVL